ncbi:hypothetical protein [Methyloceanibacter sp.]|uniref:hypothetical protein n=1 Tax=Methyloceanibacter sp. TaxID=1965321 RepID=UPI002D57D756|nr:hypothetical protein [Methyloceanibacter sp.]HZP08443.1 hypothetical protein [Methyloceanibacter sp.]
MSYIFAIMLAPWLAATGVYNPQVVDRHHRCTAEPGSFDAIYCSSASVDTAPHLKKRQAR